MEYKDEQILNARKAEAQRQIEKLTLEQRERENQESIFAGSVHIDGKEIRFSRREVRELMISLYMPETFERMDSELKDVIYPLGNAPSHAFADETIPFQMTLNQTGNTVPDDGIPKLLKMAGKLMENYGPKAHILSSGVIRRNERNIGIIELASKAIDGTVYNVMFYISIKNQVLIGNINFPNQSSGRMLPIAKEIIDSIEIMEERDGDDHISES